MLPVGVDEERVDYGDYTGDTHGDEERSAEGAVFGCTEEGVEGCDGDEGAD